MCCSLPPEILDLILDQLHDEQVTLRTSCLVSRSWVPRSRVHLFPHVKFTRVFPLELWAKAFPDPLNSLAHHTRTLVIEGATTTTIAGADEGRWIRAFCNVIHLHVVQHSFAPFHGLSPTIRSLHLKSYNARPSEVLGLICSFPLLEDLALHFFGYGAEVYYWTIPSTSPRLTGALNLGSLVGIGPIAWPLLGLPNGLNFAKIELLCKEEADFKLATDLVSGCSNTLEFLSITNCISGEFPLDLVPDRYLTTRHSQDHNDFVEPLHSRETQTVGASVHAARCTMGYRGAPNRQIQRPSTDHLSTRSQQLGARAH